MSNTASLKKEYAERIAPAFAHSDSFAGSGKTRIFQVFQGKYDSASEKILTMTERSHAH